MSKAKGPLILRYHRLMHAFAKSDDERDFYLDKMEGFILYLDLEKMESELQKIEKEVESDADRYALIPKLTFYEIKKIMEGFVNEKVYDIDTKEKLLDIIQSKDPRENFLEFIYDHLSELEKWQQYYHERFRIRIIEFLREQQFHFVFEEDIDLGKPLVEKVKQYLFAAKAPKDVVAARLKLEQKAKSYYSSEALNPRPKRGRPPKQQTRVILDPEFSSDFYTTIPSGIRSFLYVPDISSASSVTFSSRFETEEQFLKNLRSSGVRSEHYSTFEALSKRIDSLKDLSDRLMSLQGDSALPKSIDRAVQPLPSSTKIKGIATGVLPNTLGEGIKEVEGSELFQPRSPRRKRKK